MRRSTVAALLSLLAGCAGRQAAPAPAAVAPRAASEQDAIRKVVEEVVAFSAAGRLDSDEARQLLTGEALARWKTRTLGPIAGRASKITLVRNDFAVARVTASAGSEKKDFYFYATRSSAWKVSAMRTLAVGMAYEAREQLRAQQNIPDREARLKNLDLTLSTDEQLGTWFSDHHSDLDAIVKTEDEAKRAELCRSLGISTVRFESGRSVTFTIGGILDNSVGFLYLVAPEAPPQIDPGEYIWVEQIAVDWYLFRTT